MGDVTGGALIRQDVWAPPQQRHRQEEEEEGGGGPAFIPSGSVLGTGRAKPGESQGMSGFGFSFSKEKRSKMNLSQKGPNSRGLELGGTRLFCSHGGLVRVQIHHFWWKSGGLAPWEHPALPQVDPCGVSKSCPGIPGLRGAREGLNPSVIPKNQTNKPGERECPAGGEAKRGSDGKRQARGRAGSWNPIIPGKAINLCQPRSLPLLLLLFPAFPPQAGGIHPPGTKLGPQVGKLRPGVSGEPSGMWMRRRHRRRRRRRPGQMAGINRGPGSGSASRAGSANPTSSRRLCLCSSPRNPTGTAWGAFKAGKCPRETAGIGERAGISCPRVSNPKSTPGPSWGSPSRDKSRIPGKPRWFLVTVQRLTAHLEFCRPLFREV